MNKLYETYGFKNGDMHEIAKELESILNLELEERYGDNMNGDYYAYPKGVLIGEQEFEFNLVVNADPASDFYMCDYAPECLLILQAVQLGDQSRLEPALNRFKHAKAELLRRTIYDRSDLTKPVYEYQRGEAEPQ